jgi:hypothetical protein
MPDLNFPQQTSSPIADTENNTATHLQDVPPMKCAFHKTQSIPQQKINELRHQLVAAKSEAERQAIIAQLDYWQQPANG